MDWLPVWAIYGLTVVFTLAAIEFGHWLGKLWQRRNPDEKEGSMGALAGATSGLLAFLLALTASRAGSRFDRR
jgi:predicted permease